ncbi:hypothetical protein GJ700_30780 [Duganella sp. FT92W]|uniref:Uncharacterized protein n=1 Tax=Pseudoduganella rivuli TaxID=2666085 RepID=A0A7X2IU02_9BURK|nr:hypothetical protein [Pseudoduganella rivuli]MRV76105.1 hypothetical protein [Pseudoduganella rivuli]
MTRYTCTFAAVAALGFCSAVAAQAPLRQLEGEYTLASSTTAPVSTWNYTKGRIAIKTLDDEHVLILMACEWNRAPKAACDNHWYAQWHDGGVYLQDMNTDAMRLYFDPASRTLTMISRGADARGSVRRDVFSATDTPNDDPALMRRLKRAQSNADNKENLRVFGHHSKRAYANNRIEFQNPALQ